MSAVTIIMLIKQFMYAVGPNIIILQSGLNQERPYLLAIVCSIFTGLFFCIFGFIVSMKNVNHVAFILVPAMLAPWFLIGYGLYNIASILSKVSKKPSRKILILLAVILSICTLDNYFFHLNIMAFHILANPEELLTKPIHWLSPFSALALSLIWLIWFLSVAWIGCYLGKTMQSRLQHKIGTAILGFLLIASAVDATFYGERIVTLNLFKAVPEFAKKLKEEAERF